MKSNSIIKRLVYLLAFLALVFISSETNAQQVLVRAGLDNDSMYIGDQIHLHFVVEQPSNVKISFPQLADSIAGKIEILSPAKIDTQQIGNGNIRVHVQYLITCFDSGVYTIDPMKIYAVTGNNRDSLATEPLKLTVLTIPLKEANKIADIKNVIQMPITFAEVLPYILIGLGIWLLIAFIIYVIIRLKQKKPIFGFTEKPKEPAHVIAFRELEKVKGDKLWQKGQTKEYYTKVSDIVREYFENRFNVPALESTSEEILLKAKNIEIIDSRTIEELKQLLELADLVKFAKVEPMPDENENSWQTAYEFINKTYQEIVVEQPITEVN